MILLVSVELKLLLAKGKFYHPFHHGITQLMGIRLTIFTAYILSFFYTKSMNRKTSLSRGFFDSWDALVLNFKTLNKSDKTLEGSNFFAAFVSLAFIAVITKSLNDNSTGVVDVIFGFLWIVKSICLWIATSIYGKLENITTGERSFHAFLIFCIIIDIISGLLFLLFYPLSGAKFG